MTIIYSEISLILSLQEQAWALPLMKAASFLGALEFYLLFMPFIYWCGDARVGFRIALILILSVGVGSALKIVFHEPRPYWISPDVRAFEAASSFGTPSGHAQNGVCIWGMMASRFAHSDHPSRLPHISRRGLAWGSALVLILIISLSRVYLGAHFVGDVVAGWIFGGLILLGFMRLEDPIRDRMTGLGLRGKIAAYLASSVFLIALYFLSLVALDGWDIPASWISLSMASSERAIDPFRPADTLLVAGMLFGAGVGRSLFSEKGGFSAGGPAALKIPRYTIGMAGLLVIWYSPDLIVPQGLDLSSLGGFALKYLHSALAGLWVTLGAPLLFVRTGLAGWAKEAVGGQT